MALTATQIQTIIDRLEDILATKGGVAVVSFEGRMIRYEGVEAMTKALRYWESRLARLNGNRPRVMQHDLGNFDL